MDNIMCRFGVPLRLIMGNAMCFKCKEFSDFCGSYGITISYSSPYYPQGNGQAKSNNKSIMKIIKSMLDKNKKAWDSKLRLALWADRVTMKKATKKSPFELVLLQI